MSNHPIIFAFFLAVRSTALYSTRTKFQLYFQENVLTLRKYRAVARSTAVDLPISRSPTRPMASTVKHREGRHPATEYERRRTVFI